MADNTSRDEAFVSELLTRRAAVPLSPAEWASYSVRADPEARGVSYGTVRAFVHEGHRPRARVLRLLEMALVLAEAEKENMMKAATEAAAS